MSRDFPVKGLAELDKVLSHLPRNLQTGAYRAGLTAAARVIRDEARLRAPKRTGAMARSIRSGSPRKNQDGTFSVSVSLSGRAGFIGRFIEYGVSPHFITAGNSEMSARLLTRKANSEGMEAADGAMKIGESFVTGTIHHPGHAAHPFLRPALDAKADAAVAAFAERIRVYIETKTGYIAPMPEAA